MAFGACPVHVRKGLPFRKFAKKVGEGLCPEHIHHDMDSFYPVSGFTTGRNNL